jgi:hypothetical protein
MPQDRHEWAILVDALPPTLVTNAPATALKSNETPAATGLDMTAEGYLKTGSIPTGTTRVVKTYTSVSTPGATPAESADYEWHYNRLWRISGASLIYGAPRYTAAYLRQGAGVMDFNEDANSILKIMPIGNGGLAVFKATGAYLIRNASDQGGNFERSDFLQEALISTATHAVELDGAVYFINTNGVFVMEPGGAVKELSYPLKGSLPTAAAMTADYANRYVIVGATHAYDVKAQRWFKYSGTTFSYQTRAFRQVDADGRATGWPVAVNRVDFEYDLASGASDEVIKFKTQCEDRDWSDEYEVQVVNERGDHKRVGLDIEPDTCREFSLKLTELAAEIKIKRIHIRYVQYGPNSRSA